MNFGKIAKQVEKFATDNSPAILTAVGVAGTITTAVLTGKASFKAADILRNKQYVMNIGVEEREPLEKRDKVKLVWKCYIPAVGTGVITIASIILVNQIGTRRTAAMAAAYSMLDRSFDEYKEKVIEKIGQNKEIALRDDIAQDRVNKNPISQSGVIMSTGEVLCYDAYTGRYFNSSVEEIKKAQNEVNFQILHHGYASLTDFYNQIGLAATTVSEEVGWNSDKQLDIKFSAVLSEDGRPCISIDFSVAPTRGYFRLH